MTEDRMELKACPFEKVEKEIGHELYICREKEVQSLPRVGCTCGARGPLACGDDESAMEAWNTRPRDIVLPEKKEHSQGCNMSLMPKESNSYWCTCGALYYNEAIDKVKELNKQKEN